mgnify:FL=1
MGIKELREKFHEEDAKVSEKFHKSENGLKKPSWGKIVITWLIVLVIASLVFGSVFGGISSPDQTGTSTSTSNLEDTSVSDPFNGKNAKLENVTIESSYGYFTVDGKIMFKNSESVYTQLEAVVTLQDGSKIEESIVKNWNNVDKDQWYQIDGNLFSTGGNDYSLSDIKSVDFIFDGDTIYTWENN